MRAWGGIAVVGALLVAAPGVSGASEPVAVTFTYSGGAESFTVPAHVHQVTIEACGAAGGSSESVLNGVTTPGGVGGWARRVVPVSPGEVLRVRVGGTGRRPPTPPWSLREGSTGVASVRTSPGAVVAHPTSARAAMAWPTGSSWVGAAAGPARSSRSGRRCGGTGATAAAPPVRASTRTSRAGRRPEAGSAPW